MGLCIPKLKSIKPDLRTKEVFNKIKRDKIITVDDIKYLQDPYLENVLQDINMGYDYSYDDVRNMGKLGAKIIHKYSKVIKHDGWLEKRMMS